VLYEMFVILQQIAFKNLVDRNRRLELENGGPPEDGSVIRLPFIVVNTSKSTVIDCSISDDKCVFACFMFYAKLFVSVCIGGVCKPYFRINPLKIKIHSDHSL